MPIYEYKCADCGLVFEMMQRMSDGPPKECPTCSGTEISKLISKVGFQLKGMGWYETDFKNNDKKAKQDTKSGEEKKTDKPINKEKKNTDDGGGSKKAAT